VFNRRKQNNWMRIKSHYFKGMVSIEKETEVESNDFGEFIPT
jgi:hypothetical protein